MAEYVKVMATLKDEEGNALDTLKELIRLECLRKVVRWGGNAGTEICFEWYDEKQDAERQWIYDCGTSYARECLFAEYEKQLCGCVKRWE
jgi:hypothetical protein